MTEAPETIARGQKLLRCGYTTGTCAAAAAGAAASALLLHRSVKESLVHLPGGGYIRIPVCAIEESCSYEPGYSGLPREGDQAGFFVIKQAGDDPDVTDGIRIEARIRVLAAGEALPEGSFADGRTPGLFLTGGEGVGRVTQQGLEQSVGQAAINRVPRRMIFDAAGDVLREAVQSEGGASEQSGGEQSFLRLLITISVPEGRRIAAHTFNPRLGITGGISILGTSGIVEPMSERAILETIRLELGQKLLRYEGKVILVPGNYGERYVRDCLRLLDEPVLISNYVGEAIDGCVLAGASAILLVGNAGKLIKLAAGIMNTHSGTADGRREIVTAHAALCGADRKTLEAVFHAQVTDQMLAILERAGLLAPVVQSMLREIGTNLERRAGGVPCGAVLFSERYGELGRTAGTDAVLGQWLNSRQQDAGNPSV